MSTELLAHLKVLELSMKAKDEKIAGLEAELRQSIYREDQWIKLVERRERSAIDKTLAAKVKIIDHYARAPSDSVGLLTALGWVTYPVLFLAGVIAGLWLASIS